MRIHSLLAGTLLLGLLAPTVYVQAQQAATRDVGMELSATSTTVGVGEQIQVDLYLTNPSKHALTSVEALLSYDPALLKGVKVDYPQDTPFEMNLLSTGQQEFDASTGEVRMSRATLKDTSLLPDTTYPFATMTFEGVASGTASIQFVPTKSGLDRVTANATVEGISTNILDAAGLTPLSVTVSGTRGSAATNANANASVGTNSNANTGTTGGVTNIFAGGNTNANSAVTNTNSSLSVSNANSNTTVVTSNTNTNFATLSNTNTNSVWSTVTTTASNMNTNATIAQTLDAPRDIAIKKQGKAITLYWSNDDIAQTTYVYYSSSPESFTTRKRIDYPNNSFAFTSMPAKGTYYFILTSADATGKESAYTPMFVVDGTKDGIYYENDSYLSKVVDRGSLAAQSVLTQGVSDAARASLSKVPSMPENGPAEMILLMLLLSLGGGAFAHMRRNTSTV